MSSQKVSGANGQSFFEKLLNFLPTRDSLSGSMDQLFGRAGFSTAIDFLIGQANDGTGASRFSARGQQTTGAAREVAQNGGFETVNLDDFLSVNKGSDAAIAIIVGNAEGTRTPNGGFTRVYYGHPDPGDRGHNIGSFSYSASRGNGNATTPVAADRLMLQDLNRVRQTYETRVRAAGLDPNNALLAASFFDAHIQSPRSAGRFLSPANLAYIRENGINTQTMAETRFRSWINPETGNLYRTASGGFSASGFAQIARDRLGVRNPTEAQVQQVARQDQGRRVGELVRALRAQGLADGSAATAPTNPTAPNAPITQVGGALRRGSTGEAVRNLQNNLVRLGEMTNSQMQTGVGIYGPQTKGAVESFQRAAGLPVTGEFDARTGRAMSDVLGAMRRGDNSHPALIRNVQDRLVELGYLTRGQIGGGAGVFGPRTEAALKTFQAQNGIPNTGRLGPLTYRALFNAENVSPNSPTNNTPPRTGNGARPAVNRGFTEFSDGPGNHYNVEVANVGRIRVTEGFLVSGPHSPKNGIQAITGDGTLQRIPNGRRVNLGIDYVVQDPQNRVRNWFGGEVVDTERSNRGYGNRVVVRTDQTYNLNGRNYPVFTHYAHLDRIDVREQQRIEAGSFIGIMGNTGASHGAHVDQRFWIETQQGKIDISPNLLVNRR